MNPLQPTLPALPALPGGAASRCPRCGAGFHCGVADAAPCACTTLRLSATMLAAMRQQFDGCLCLACLAGLASQQDLNLSSGSGAAPPTRPK